MLVEESKYYLRTWSDGLDIVEIRGNQHRIIKATWPLSMNSALRGWTWSDIDYSKNKYPEITKEEVFLQCL